MSYNTSKIRSDFPMLTSKVHKNKLVYFDNSASTQKPSHVLDAMNSFYQNSYSNIHRGVHTYSLKATELFEDARETVCRFINAGNSKNIIFTKGTTESLNIVAFGLMHTLKKGDTILVSAMEHHSNFVPWQEVSKHTGSLLKIIPVKQGGELDLIAYKKLLNKHVKVVAITHMSNVTGKKNDIKKITTLAKKTNAFVIVDGAQIVAHEKIDVKKLGCDAYAFSGHKMYGPTGIGILYGTEKLLHEMRPLLYGGDMIVNVTEKNTIYAKAPAKFEGGTPPIAEAIGLKSALEYLNKVGLKEIAEHEKKLLIETVKVLKKYPIDKIFYEGNIVSFTLKNIHPHDVGTVFDKFGIAIRTGHACSQIYLHALGLNAISRISFGMYNTIDEVKKIKNAMDELMNLFK